MSACARSGFDNEADYFRVAAENAPAMLWIGDEDGRCLFLNRAQRTFWGVRDLDSFSWADTLHPDDVEPLFAAFGRAMAAREAFEVEARYRRADGSFRILHTRAEPRFDESGRFLGMVGVNTDVTDQREAARMLRIQALILEHMTEGVSLSDVDGTIVYTNRAQDDLFGFGPGALVGRHVAAQAAYDPDEKGRVFGAIMADLQETGRWSGDLRHRRADGSGFVSAGTITVVEIGGTRHLLSVQRDVTEARKAEQRERMLTREVDHRAKNALAVVQSIVRLTPFKDRDDYVATITGRIDSMARVHALLARNTWSGATLEQILGAELAPFETDGRFRVEGPEVQLRLEAAQPLTLLIHELTTNASKYGSLSVPEGRLEVVWRIEDDGEVVLDWTESGGPAVKPPVSMGFGTRLIRGCAGQLGGRVSKDWRPDGLRCRVVIGAPQLRADPGAGIIQERDRPRHRRLDGSTVLVVEDEILLGLEISDHLEHAGARVIGPAQTLRAALALAASERFDAVVLDMNIGGSSAEPLLRMLEAAEIPAVVVTGYEELESTRPILRKPVDRPALLDALAGELESRPGRSIEPPRAGAPA